MYIGRLWIWKKRMIRLIGMVYVADAKSVWNWRKIVESSAEFLSLFPEGIDLSECFRQMLD